MDNSGLDQILKNTEFENSQQLKAIESEKEKIQAYEQQIEEYEAQICKLKTQITACEEQTANFTKQYSINKENIDSLKKTSVVLAEHEEALKKKVQCQLDEVCQEKLQQSNALAKYEAVWARYEAKYDSMEKVQELKQKKEELSIMNKQNESMEVKIKELETTLQEMRIKGREQPLKSWILQIASLRVDTNKNVAKRRADVSKVSTLKAEIMRLQEERSHMEAEISSGTSVEQQNFIKEPIRDVYQMKDSMETVAVAQPCSEPTEKAEHLPTSSSSSIEKNYFEPQTLPVHNTIFSPSGSENSSASMKKFAAVSSQSQNSSKPENNSAATFSLKTTPVPRYRLEMPQLRSLPRKTRSESLNSMPRASLFQLPFASNSSAPSNKGRNIPMNTTDTSTQVQAKAPIFTSGVGTSQSTPPQMPTLSQSPMELSHSGMSQPKQSRVPLQLASKPATEPIKDSEPSQLQIESSPKSRPCDQHGFQFKVTKEQVNVFQQVNTAPSSHSSVNNSALPKQVNRDSEGYIESSNHTTQGDEKLQTHNIPAENIDWNNSTMIHTQPSDNAMTAKPTSITTAPNTTSHQTIVPSTPAIIVTDTTYPQTSAFGSMEGEYQFQGGPGVMYQSSVNNFNGNMLASKSNFQDQLQYERQPSPPSQNISTGNTLFNSEPSGGFSFGGFGQSDLGSSFGGGFGFFGEQQQKNNGASSFGSGFSFGSSQQNTSGFSLNFGNSDNSSSFSMF